MNHADRERLSKLLDTLSKEIDYSDPKIYTPDHKEMARLIAEARAIVDSPNTRTVIEMDGITVTRYHELNDKGPYAEPPNQALDAFLTEPIHEYRDRGHHRAPRRPIRVALALTIAGIALTGLTTASTPQVGPNGPRTHSEPAKPPPRPAQTGFWPTGPTLTPPGAP